jgi:hypothetical protein
MRAVFLFLTALSLLTPPLSAADMPKKENKTLYGRIDMIGEMCSSAGVTLASRNMPTTVENLRAGSPAYYSGLAEGDRVLAGSVENNKVVLQIERNGKKYAVQLATMYNPLQAESAKTGKTKSPVLSGSAQQLASSLTLISKYDIVLVVDRSGSMNEPVNGSSGLSKWQWCEDNISQFTSQIKPYLTGDGIELVTFDTSYTIQKNCTPETVKEIFAKEKPSGATDLASPLKALFAQHFAGNLKRPMLIAVLTDGMPNRGSVLNDVIIDATHRLHSAEEVRLVFMQVGNEFEGKALLQTLDDYLVHNGATFDIVDSVAFGNMTKGLLEPLCITIEHDWHPVLTGVGQGEPPPSSHIERSYEITPPVKKPSEP